VYAAQLHWLWTHFTRSQILLLNMHTALTSRSPNAYLQEVLDHLQIPVTAHLNHLAHSNSATADQASDVLNCSTHAQLSAIFEPFNEILYAMEPDFDRFPPASDVPCSPSIHPHKRAANGKGEESTSSKRQARQLHHVHKR
jgi:hypothetical protein